MNEDISKKCYQHIWNNKERSIEAVQINIDTLRSNKEYRSLWNNLGRGMFIKKWNDKNGNGSMILYKNDELIGYSYCENCNDTWKELCGVMTRDEFFTQLLADDTGKTPASRGKMRIIVGQNFKEINLTEPKTNYMNTFKNTIKNLMRTEPEKTFVEVGFLDTEENITTKGREALEYILWEKNKDELKKLADQIVSKESNR